MRLPLEHPDYRYPASKNPYWTKLHSYEGLVYWDNLTEAHAGSWRSKFPDGDTHPERLLHVEVGCNTGHVVREWAARNPRDAYIGLDWKFKIIFRGAEMAKKKGLKNLIFFRSHAERLHYMFGKGEIDRLYLFFPDPWPKKSQRKNRFVTAERLKLLAPLMREHGIFHIKTDHRGYFEWMEEAIDQVKDVWEVVEHTRDLHAGHPDPSRLEIPDVTLFEKLFIKDGIPINSVKLRARR